MSENSNSGKWTSAYVYTQATVCLLLGLLCGYLLRGASAVSNAAAPPAVAAQPAAEAAPSQVTPEQLQQMAEKKAGPLLAQLKVTPNDPELLAKLGYLYYATHNFQQAAAYYERSVSIRDTVAVRTELGRSYYYAGDPDRALAEFERIVKANPADANALYNAGMIRWKDKFDVDGAIAAWRQLLKTNPNHPQRAEVEQLIANARKHESVKTTARK